MPGQQETALLQPHNNPRSLSLARRFVNSRSRIRSRNMLIISRVAVRRASRSTECNKPVNSNKQGSNSKSSNKLVIIRHKLVNN